MNLYWAYSGTTAGINVAWPVAFGCLHLGTDGLGTGTWSNYQTMTVTTAGTTGFMTHVGTFTGLTVPAACIGTDEFTLRVARQQGANGDTTASGDTVYLLGVQLLWN
jgi:hypothetical protein